MFPLPCKALPPDADALRAALEESLRQVLTPVTPIVTLEEKSYPQLASICVSLDGANVGDRPRPPQPVGMIEPALRVEHFEMHGRPIVVQGARMELSCSARELQLGQSRDKEGNVLLILQDAAEGRLEVAIGLADLEALVLARAKTEAEKQGVTVESVRIELRPRSEQALDVVVRVRAKKLFLNATVQIMGSAAIDEQLNARLFGLECAGEGPLGTLACGFIAPHLQRCNGREVSLMSLPLGEIKLRGVRIAAGRELRITAEFGHPV
jgi:hypothetical protein